MFAPIKRAVRVVVLEERHQRRRHRNDLHRRDVHVLDRCADISSNSPLETAGDQFFGEAALLVELGELACAIT
jgi:hypothetical protein